MEIAKLQRTKLPAFPERLEGLALLACNLSWCWNRQARALFRRIDPTLWRQSSHNPIKLLRSVAPERLEALTHDHDFLAHFDEVMAWLEIERAGNEGWFHERWPELTSEHPIAYFCAEFGLHSSVPIYSGGLGVLAGDHCSTSSDLAVPLVGVGLFYKKGYFDQRVRPDGWQEDGDDVINPELTPLVQLPGVDGNRWFTVLETFGRPVHIAVWGMTVGHTPIYLLDTDLDVNDPEDRTLTSRLYAGGLPLRLRQEWVLGVGGTRVLEVLGINPGAWHANEGHAAFQMLERVRRDVAAGADLNETIAKVRSTSLFTTHTPVAAGHDRFSTSNVAACAGPGWLADFGVPEDEVIALGRHPGRDPDEFHMTVLALRLAGHVNGVAQRHGEVSRRLWKALWPDKAEQDVPIGSVTNGVHLATWMSNAIMRLLDRHLGTDWGDRRDDAETWDAVLGLDNVSLWEEHQRLKEQLLHHIREDARRRWCGTWTEAAQVVASGTLLDPNAFTIGFARRFATYKRAGLPFRDMERLRRLLTDQQRPVQLVIAGKAHPQDDLGKEILQAVYFSSRDPMFAGRVAFLEDYDMHLAKLMVQGVDLWLNLPRVPMEASGTSGMKAALNGVPQLSTEDGWWEEGATGRNGWTIPRADQSADIEAVDAADAEHLYRLLEEEIVPMWYDRNGDGVPQAWALRMKESIRVAGRDFTARRMLQDYSERYYVPILGGTGFTDDPPTG